MQHHRPLLFVLLFACFAAPAAGQQVRIHGRVISDETGEPLSAAKVTLRRADGGFVRRVETDSAGAFEFITTRLSAVRIRAERMGYRANTTPVLHFDGKRFFEVEVRLDTDAILLAPLEVIVWSDVDRSPLLEGFRQRRSGGFGYYITRKDIEARKPFNVTDILRTVPGVQVVGGGGGNRPRVEIGRALGKRCSAQVFVDGMLVNRRSLGMDPDDNDFRLDDVVSPLSIEGIEVYRGLSTIPPEFLNPDAECGVIAVWTKRGGGRGH